MANKLSDNAKIVLTYLQDHDGEEFTHKIIAEDTGLSPRSVTGTLTGLQKRGFAERVAVEGSKDKLVHATPEGLAFNVDDDLPEN